MVMLQGASVPLSAPIAVLRDGDQVELVLKAGAHSGLAGKKTRRGKRAGKRHAPAPANGSSATAGESEDGANVASSRLQLPVKRGLSSTAPKHPAATRPAAKRMRAETDEGVVLAADAALEAAAKAYPAMLGAEPAWLPVADDVGSLELVRCTSMIRHCAFVPCRLRRLRLSATMTPEVGNWEHGVLQLPQRIAAHGTAARPEANASSASAVRDVADAAGGAGASAHALSSESIGRSRSSSSGAGGCDAGAGSAAAAGVGCPPVSGSCTWIPLGARPKGEWSALLRGVAILEAQVSHAVSASSPDGPAMLSSSAAASDSSSMHVDASWQSAAGMSRLTVCCFDVAADPLLLASSAAGGGDEDSASSAAGSYMAAPAAGFTAAADTAASDWDWSDVVEAQLLSFISPIQHKAAAAGSAVLTSSASKAPPAAAEVPTASLCSDATSNAGLQSSSDAALARATAVPSPDPLPIAAPPPARRRRGPGAGMSLAGLAQQLGFGKA